jgi:imidazolonepropionase-like amidohydrolase
MANRRTAGLGSTVALLLGLTAAAGAQTAVAVVGARLIDGLGGPPVENAVVLIQGDRIVAAGPAGTITVPAGARVIAGRGLTALPGLADLHTHLLGGWDGEAVDLLAYRRTLGALLYAGVTTVLDPGDVTTYV